MASTAQNHKPRIICYHQTHYDNGEYVSIMPLITEDTGVSHLIVAAIHINQTPGDVTLNDDPWNAEKNQLLWEEVQLLQSTGIKVLGMLGGAAKGSYTRLDSRDRHRFEVYYQPLRELIITTGLDGLDLDVEEEMSLAGIIRLILRLKADFGEEFIITLAPVATALMQGMRHLSGFSYFDLDKAIGDRIAWMNTQFYCGWGYLHSTEDYERILAHGWPPEKIVCGVVSNPLNGKGHVPDMQLRQTVSTLMKRYTGFGGMFCWEYFNAITDATPAIGTPWSWPQMVKATLFPAIAAAPAPVIPENQLPSSVPVASTGVQAEAEAGERLEAELSNLFKGGSSSGYKPSN